MVFSSFDFLFFFLPAILAVYFGSPNRVRNLVLFIGSITFYAIGGRDFVLILFVSIFVDYVAGFLAGRSFERSDDRLKRIAIAMSLVANLGLLAFFKYANFLLEQVNEVSRITGLGGFTWQRVVLPIGISFFTFQSMSYTMDVARGRVAPIRNPLDFALYVSLFPQLIAGPIVRFHEIADQIRSRVTSVDGFALGAVRFSHGLAKKVLIADSVAPVADAAFGAPPGELSAVAAWIGVLAYTVQIYFDFSGYSDMAIGMGQMFGFDFPENFARPYSAVSITDFWRRWHITLSNWFRDYLYIPMGGSRGSNSETLRNLLVVFFLTGLWHGANWTFVLWGAYHGAILVAERVMGLRGLEERPDMAPLRRVITFVLVLVGWVLFRSPSVGHAVSYLSALATSGGMIPPELAISLTTKAVLAGAIGLASVTLPRHFVVGQMITGASGRVAVALRTSTLVISLPLAAVVMSAGTFSPFLYYQF